MSQKIIIELLVWLQNNYGVGSIRKADFGLSSIGRDQDYYQDNNIVLCDITEELSLKISTQSAHEEALTDWTICLIYAGESSSITNRYFSIRDNEGADIVIEHIEDFLVDYCLKLLPKRLVIIEQKIYGK